MGLDLELELRILVARVAPNNPSGGNTKWKPLISDFYWKISSLLILKPSSKWPLNSMCSSSWLSSIFLPAHAFYSCVWHFLPQYSKNIYDADLFTSKLTFIKANQENKNNFYSKYSPNCSSGWVPSRINATSRWPGENKQYKCQHRQTERPKNLKKKSPEKN